MTTVSFDGANKLIILDNEGVTDYQVDIIDIYSRWKDWVLGGNAEWDEAFGLSVGGNDLGGGQSLDGYFFIRNDLGWRLRPDEANGQVTLTGNLYPFDPGVEFINPTVGAFTVSVRQAFSSRAIVDSSAGGGSVDYERIRDDIIPHVWAARPRR